MAFIPMNNSSLITYPLHLAVSMNDFSALKRLLNSHTLCLDIEARDDLNLTPLQVAAYMGNADMVKLLIQHGADVCANGGYDQNFSALSLAVLEGHHEVVKVLAQGNHLENLSSKDKGIAFIYNLDNLFILIQDVENDPKPFENALDIFLTLVNTQELPLIDFEDYFTFSEDVFSEPAALWLEVLTRYAPTKEIWQRLMNEVDKINAQDDCYQTYIDAKLLLHVLPVNNSDYTLSYYTQEGEEHIALINPYGFMACYTTPFASQEIDQYLTVLDNYWSGTWDAFYDLSEIYHQAIVFSQEPAIFENSILAYNLYQKGQTLLLATGWDGHAINVILDPQHDYFIVANAGERYEPLASGARIYKIHNTDNLTPNLIFDILNNSDQINLEFACKYELALDNVLNIEQPEQEHGNCAWYSHKPSVEALLYIHFLNEGLSSPKAQKLAHGHYLGWETYQTKHCLEDYFDHDPKLGIDAVLDILIDYHPSLFKESCEPINPKEYDQAQYLAKVLTTDRYHDDFYEHFCAKFSDAKSELIDLFKSVDLLDFNFSPDEFKVPEIEPMDLSLSAPFALDLLPEFSRELQAI